MFVRQEYTGCREAHFKNKMKGLRFSEALLLSLSQHTKAVTVFR